MATAYNVEYNGNLKRIPVEHSLTKVKAYEDKIREAFKIQHPFVLTYSGAELSGEETLADLELEKNTPIRVRQRGAIGEIYDAKLQEKPSAAQTEKPLIFLSYEWGCQSLVRRLGEHLVKEGFSCWMDIKRMQAGDPLYSSIDEGIRGCRVFLCCINKKYSQSTNCRRELSLAASLKKCIIPLILEEVTWPPEKIGSLLSELIYIKFYSTNSKDSFWPDQQYAKLIQQLKSLQHS